MGDRRFDREALLSEMEKMTEKADTCWVWNGWKRKNADLCSKRTNPGRAGA